VSDLPESHELQQTFGAGGGFGGVGRRSVSARSLAKWSWRLLWTPIKLACRVVSAPVRILLTVRRNMTVASVAVLLAGIMTLNIIWGYPWIGMFAACISLLCVGLLANFWMRPRLRIDFSLPSSTAAGQPCNVVAHCTNTRRVPAFDFSLGFCAADGHRGRRQRSADKAAEIQTSPANWFAMARPGDRLDIPSTVVFPRRGIHPVPNLVITSTFPFYLFRHRQVIEPDAAIAVTPRPLTAADEGATQSLINAVGDWTRRVLSGDSLDYSGSREYQPGMPVIRWDFLSWARLGRPIVREFQSPSIQSVLLLVDTGISPAHGDDRDSELLERALSLAAAAINDLVAKSIGLQLYLTSELPAAHQASAKARPTNADAESMQIRLAEAEATESAVADDRLCQVIQESLGGPTLLITSRRDSTTINDFAGMITVICVDQQSGSDDADSSAGDQQRNLRMDRAHLAADGLAEAGEHAHAFDSSPGLPEGGENR
jgi:uncharacterized protein (DUF58 family)